MSSAPPGTTSASVPNRTPRVPIDALRASPGRSSRWRRIPAVVLFPFVPVIPIMRSSRDGSPNAAPAAIAAAFRPSRTTMTRKLRAHGSSTIAADAPCFVAAIEIVVAVERRSSHGDEQRSGRNLRLSSEIASNESGRSPRVPTRSPAGSRADDTVQRKAHHGMC